MGKVWPITSLKWEWWLLCWMLSSVETWVLSTDSTWWQRFFDPYNVWPRNSTTTGTALGTRTKSNSFATESSYRLASGLKTKPEYEQVSTLLNTMGDCADDILATLCFNETKATYDEVHTTLNGYFDICHNSIVQRALFNKRHQLAGESVDTSFRIYTGLQKSAGMVH